MQEFYVRKGRKIYGPYNTQALKRLYNEGKLRHSDEVGSSLTGPWHSVENVKGLGRTQPVDEPPHSDPQQGDLVEQDSAVTPPQLPAPTGVLTREPPALPPMPAPTAAINGQSATAKPIGARKFLAYAILVVAVLAAGATGYVLLSGAKVSVNPVQSLANDRLQGRLDGCITADGRNRGIGVRAYYRGAVSRDVVVFDIHSVDSGKAPLDVFRLFLDFAEELRNDRLTSVELAFRGESRFAISGTYFRTLGIERNDQNPLYTIRTFPENVRTLDGVLAFPKWTGGALGVLGKQMEDFNELNHRWYLDDLRNAQ